MNRALEKNAVQPALDLPRLSLPEDGCPDMRMSDMRADMLLLAILDRVERVIGHSGYAITVDAVRTRFVIPGVRLTCSEGGFTMRVWIGVNEDRIFYIQTMPNPPEESQSIFKFAFGGAQKIGWTFNYEGVKVGEDAQHTSAWGTVETGVSFTEERQVAKVGDDDLVTHDFRLSTKGAFWANDLAMMLQSAFRTAQRHGLQTDLIPEPL